MTWTSLDAQRALDTLSRANACLPRSFGKPATDSRISSLETHLCNPIPTSLRQCLAIADEWGWIAPVYGTVWLLTPEEIIEESRRPLNEDDEVLVSTSDSEAVRPTYYNEGRVTFASSENYKFQIDFIPDLSGVYGQVVLVDEYEECISLFSESTDAFLRIALQSLESEIALQEAGNARKS